MLNVVHVGSLHFSFIVLNISFRTVFVLHVVKCILVFYSSLLSCLWRYIAGIHGLTAVIYNVHVLLTFYLHNENHLYTESSKLHSVGFHRYILTNIDGDTLKGLEQEVLEFDPSSEVSILASLDRKRTL